MSNIKTSGLASSTKPFQLMVVTKNTSNVATEFANTSNPSDFTVVPAGKGAKVEMVKVEVTGTGARTLTVHPELTPGETYTVTVVNHTGENSVALFMPLALAPSDHPHFPLPPLEAITLACGQIFQQYVGIPETVILKDFDSGADTVIFSETSLGFPDKGSFYVNERKFNYTGRFSGGFTGVSAAVPVGIPTTQSGAISNSILSSGSLLRFDILDHGPEDEIA